MSVTIKKDFGEDRNRRRPDISSLIYGKVPPQAIELEKAILGIIMLQPDKLDLVLRIIKNAECFYVDAHQKIYKAIITLVGVGSAADPLLIAEELKKQSEFEIVGGMYYLMSLTDVTSDASVEKYARVVMEKFMAREVITICGNAISDAYEDSSDVFEVLGKAETGLTSILDNIKSGSIKNFAEIFRATIKDMLEAKERPGTMLGVTTGLKKLDAILLGFAPPDLTILAAGTREGKTTLALNSCKAAAEAGDPAGFISLEMKDRQLMLKVLSGEVQEDIKTLRTGKFGEDKWSALTGSILKSVSALPIYVYDIGGLNIVELKAIARTMKKKYKIKILYIDYLQLIVGAGKKFGTREEEVNYISKQLKSLAMELDIPIVALSQLNRPPKGVKRNYVLQDLRESGAIEQDADNVIFIYRPSLHEVAEMEVGGETWRFGEMDAVVSIAKCRLGEEGDIRATFYGKYNQFVDYDSFPEMQQSSQHSPYSQGLSNAGHNQVRNTPGFQQPRSPESEWTPDKPF